ncbi:MAG: rod shape-determining protein MreD [Pseudomonadota bacterium]
MVVRPSETSSEQGVTFLRHALPFSTCLIASFIDLLPIPSASPEAVSPSLTLAAVFFWSLHRPDLFSNFVCFGFGVFVDAVGGAPMGMTALIFLAVRSMLMTTERYLVAKTFFIVWFYFILISVLAVFLKWILGSLWSQSLLSGEAFVVEWLLTIAVYPFVTLVLSTLHNAFPKNDELAET